jgi:addiction module RelE/StbE family toxin
MSIRYTRRASIDLLNIQEYIAKDNPAAAYRTTQLIRRRIEQLAEQPGLGRSGRVAGSRELVIAGTPYVVAYRIADRHIDVLAVLHGARQWPDTL